MNAALGNQLWLTEMRVNTSQEHCSLHRDCYPKREEEMEKRENESAPPLHPLSSSLKVSAVVCKEPKPLFPVRGSSSEFWWISFPSECFKEEKAGRQLEGDCSLNTLNSSWWVQRVSLDRLISRDCYAGVEQVTLTSSTLNYMIITFTKVCLLIQQCPFSLSFLYSKAWSSADCIRSVTPRTNCFSAVAGMMKGAGKGCVCVCVRGREIQIEKEERVSYHFWK